MSALGAELLKQRTKAGWTLREVQKRSGVSRQTVFRAETGEFISMGVILKLVTIYNLSNTAKRSLLNQYADETIKRVTTKRRKARSARATA